MKSYLLLIGILLLSSLAQAADVTVNVGGKDATVQYRVIDREITEKDRNTGSQSSALDCSMQYYSLLARSDVKAAAQLTTDPAAATEMWTQYQKRLGAADFKKEMADYFTSRNRFIAEFVFADEAMLIIKTADDTGAQLYRLNSGKYFVITGRPFSEASRVLGKTLNMIKEGKIKL